MSVSRRNFAKALGAGLLMAPFLSFNKPARAQSAPRAKRLLLFCTMGTNPAIWTPPSASNLFNQATQPLSAIAGDVVLVDGLMSSDPGENHASPEALTGKGFSDSNHMSVDQFLAAGVTKSDTIPALLLGANTSAGGGRTLFYNNGRNLPTINSPIDAFNTIFSGVTGSSMPSAALARKQSILDQVTGDVNSLSSSLGATEKAKLALHLDSIRQLENRLSGTGTGGASASCKSPAKPTIDGTNLLQADLVHLDLIVSAFACGLTRVAAIQFGSDQSVPVNLPTLQGEEHGEFIHGGAGSNYAQLVQLEQWYAQTFVDLVNKLKTTPEADGSGMLYDNTLLVWTRDMGDSVNHNQQSMPYVLAGGAGGYLKRAPAGRYVHYKSSSVADRHERLLLNVLQAMGASYSGFGLLTGGDQTPLPDLIA